jgi:hypothetical protein
VIKNYLLLLILLSAVVAKAQYLPLSENSEVSILTIGPGTDLNDAFGHNGFRIHDEVNKVDIVYDYGRYDFNTPNFYLKFARGKLLYELGSANFEPFFSYYKSQNRWVKEQTLNLSYSEKQALFTFLQKNAKPENKKYKYDFFYDNCATKIRDVLIDVLGDKLHYTEDHINEDYTFRQLIQKNVKANSWGSLGMDIAIGAVVDRKAKPIEYQFLPEYINKGAENAIIKRGDIEVPLVVKSATLFNAEKQEDADSFFGSPLFVFGCLGLLIVFITYNDFKNKSRSRLTDAIIFFCSGIIGFLLLLLWFATDHTATANNYNLLWAVPISLLFFGSILRKEPKKWFKKYVFFLLLLLALLTIHWITGVQEFAIGLLPLLVALLIRYVYLWRYLSKKYT